MNRRSFLGSAITGWLSSLLAPTTQANEASLAKAQAVLPSEKYEFEPISHEIIRAIHSYRESQINGFLHEETIADSLRSLDPFTVMSEYRLMSFSIPRGLGKTYTVARIAYSLPNMVFVAPTTRQAELIRNEMEKQRWENWWEFKHRKTIERPLPTSSIVSISQLLAGQVGINFDGVVVDEWNQISRRRQVKLLQSFHPAALKDPQFGIFTLYSGLDSYDHEEEGKRFDGKPTATEIRGRRLTPEQLNLVDMSHLSQEDQRRLHTSCVANQFQHPRIKF